VPAAYAAGKQAHVPLLAGWNRDEGSWLANGMTAEKWKAYGGRDVQGSRGGVLKLYPGETRMSRLSRIGGRLRWRLVHRFRHLEVDGGASEDGESPVYRYHFELRRRPANIIQGSFAFHSDDIEYVFGTLDTRPGETVWRPEDRKLSDEMMSYWTNFAKTGDPNGTGLPEWPKYGKDDELIHLDSTITSWPDALRPRYEFLLKGMPAFHF
jgi:para-nitrobenzyl esterase